MGGGLRPRKVPERGVACWEAGGGWDAAGARGRPLFASTWGARAAGDASGPGRAVTVPPDAGKGAGGRRGPRREAPVGRGDTLVAALRNSGCRLPGVAKVTAKAHRTLAAHGGSETQSTAWGLAKAVLLFL
jgi:hypothetical protein